MAHARDGAANNVNASVRRRAFMRAVLHQCATKSASERVTRRVRDRDGGDTDACILQRQMRAFCNETVSLRAGVLWTAFMAGTPRLSDVAARIRPGVFAELQKHIDAYSARGGAITPFHIGDTILTPPPEARYEASIDDGAELYRYGGTAGLASLRDAIATRLASRGWSDIGEKHVLIGAGATHALFCAARTVLDPGDEVLVGAPYWPLSVGVFSGCSARPVEVPLTSLLYADPSIDAGACFADAITPRTKALYLITPNNPDGKVLSRQHLEQIAALALEHDLWVFADEVYADAAYEAPHVSIATLPEMRARTITAYSLSKSHALAGARVGYGIAPEEVIAAARRVSTHTVFNVPVLSQRAALAALVHGEPWVASARATYRAARDEAVRALEGAPVAFSIAEGGSYLFLDFTQLLDGRPLSVLMERAIERGVLLAPGDACGLAYDRCARLCYTGVTPTELRDGIARLREAMDSLLKR